MEFKDWFIPIVTVAVTCVLTYFFTIRSTKYKQDLIYKERAAKISELLACWIKYSPKQLAELTAKEKSDFYERLNQLTWELAIWVPDDKIVKAIMDRFSYRGDQNVQQLILSTRNILHKKSSGELQWNDIAYWTVEEDERREHKRKEKLHGNNNS